MIVVNLGVEDSRDFEFWIIIDIDWWGWGLNAIGDWIWSCWFQHRDVEKQCTAQRWSGSCMVTEWVPGSSRISYSPRNLLDSFLEGHVSLEELSLDIYLASNLEF